MSRFVRHGAAVLVALLLTVATIVPVATAPAAHAATVFAMPAIA